ncbi:hypothetical protein PF005_g24959 [Phytophthora fragariae]|uniref:Uncharacterized protein n=1 Tax=Phytophthora fragariae TaxID=53985 RepID=A0A6A3IDZ5_9STRA|nr:hypothetical protein PF009_g9270 [Phytophthora fragariae]KAE8978578.1 hypothetical protein PF011_g23186 [Phytophthora fragariae]KAE9095833.1 hypothetical protein PF006_g23918 [Phytophthora fragariae]KAE9119648.1 hypothetical protein PF010_g7785 [Phytophthora fragariae]KAE9176436.1 hypothetical protein PF005_g24959 [Phytophthora fragariae]
MCNQQWLSSNSACVIILNIFSALQLATTNTNLPFCDLLKSNRIRVSNFETCSE